jgi:hypothetical protein
MTTRAVITEDWQRDAIKVVLVDHDTHQVSVVTGAGRRGLTPIMLSMVRYDPGELTATDAEEAGITLPLTVARSLYEALGRHFGDHQDPASRELVDTLKAQAEREAGRVDTLLAYATQPPVMLEAVSGG